MGAIGNDGDEYRYGNECYHCGHGWLSWHDDEPCPECGEIADISPGKLEEDE